jgi:hypothetical protein
MLMRGLSKCHWILAISLVLSTTAHAQNNVVDISGTWQLDIAKSKPAKVANKYPTLKPATLVIPSTGEYNMRYTNSHSTGIAGEGKIIHTRWKGKKS